jgi:hypothetical protein
MKLITGLLFLLVPGLVMELLSNLVYAAIRQRSELMPHLPPARRL